MDDADEDLIRKVVDRCKEGVMTNAPFEKMAFLLDVLSERYNDRHVKSEMKRVRLAISNVTRLKRPSTRRECFAQLVGFVDRLSGAIRAARIRSEIARDRAAAGQD